MRIPKVTYRVGGKMMDVTVTFSLNINQLVSVVITHLTENEEFPKNRTSCIILVKRHLRNFGNSNWHSYYNSTNDDTIRRAWEWVKTNFPEFDNA